MMRKIRTTLLSLAAGATLLPIVLLNNDAGALTPHGPAVRSVSGRVAPAITCSSSRSGGPVNLSTVLARAQAWVSANISYSQNACNGPAGDSYRTDCSGFVSMAWELSSSLTTYQFNPAINGGDARFQSVNRVALKPGDALVEDGNGTDHIALFTGWSSTDGGQHRYAELSEEADESTGTVHVAGADLAAGYWSTFTPIHYVNLSPDPAGSAVLTPDGYHDFWVDPATGHMMQSWYVSASPGWHVQDLGGTLSGTPGVTYHDGRYDVFAAAPNGNVYQDMYTPSSGWSGWQSRLSGWLPGVSAVFDGSSYHVFGHNSAGAVLQGLFTSGWQTQNLGGTTYGTPGVTDHAGIFDVFSISGSGALYERSYDAGWGDWHLLPGGGTYGTAAGVAAVWGGSGDYIFAPNAGGHLYEQYYNGSWSAPQSLGGTLSDAVGVTYSAGRFDLFGPANGGLYQQTYYPGSGWNGWHRIS